MTNYPEEFYIPHIDDESSPFCATQDISVQLCGHAMHLKCFDGYFATVVLKSEQQQGMPETYYVFKYSITHISS